MAETYKGYGESQMTVEGLRRFVRHGNPGEWVTYFTGSALPYRPGAMWEMASELCKAGYLILVQKRVGNAEPPSLVGRFEYKACRTSKPWSEPEKAAKTKLMMRA